MMNRKYLLIWTALIVLGSNSAWAQDAEEPALPEPAADEAREAAQLPEAAADGLSVAAEATIRLMEDDGDEVTHDVELPELPEEGAAGQQGLDIAAEAIAGGADFGLDMADGAQDAAEGRGRAESVPDDLPGRPDNIPAGPPEGL